MVKSVAHWHGPPKPKIHTCSVCRAAQEWGSAWGWFGSWKDLEDGKPVVKCCSNGCFKEAKAMKLIPMDVELIDDE